MSEVVEECDKIIDELEDMRAKSANSYNPVFKAKIAEQAATKSMRLIVLLKNRIEMLEGEKGE